MARRHPTFLDAIVWGAQAEHIAQCLRKGQRVVVIGRLVTRVFTPTEHERRERAAIWHNHHTSQPTTRSLTAYDH